MTLGIVFTRLERRRGVSMKRWLNDLNGRLSLSQNKSTGGETIYSLKYAVLRFHRWRYAPVSAFKSLTKLTSGKLVTRQATHNKLQLLLCPETLGSRSSTHHVVSSVLFSYQHLPLLNIYVDSLPGQSPGQKTMEHELSSEASLGLTEVKTCRNNSAPIAFC